MIEWTNIADCFLDFEDFAAIIIEEMLIYRHCFWSITFAIGDVHTDCARCVRAWATIKKIQQISSA